MDALPAPAVAETDTAEERMEDAERQLSEMSRAAASAMGPGHDKDLLDAAVLARESAEAEAQKLRSALSAAALPRMANAWSGWTWSAAVETARALLAARPDTVNGDLTADGPAQPPAPDGAAR